MSRRKTFDVEVRRTTVRTTFVNVKAHSPKEAEKLALTKAKELFDDEWESLYDRVDSVFQVQERKRNGKTGP